MFDIFELFFKTVCFHGFIESVVKDVTPSRPSEPITWRLFAPLLNVLLLSSAFCWRRFQCKTQRGYCSEHKHKLLSGWAPLTADIRVCHLPRGFSLLRLFTQQIQSKLSDLHFKEMLISCWCSFAYFNSHPAVSQIDSANRSRIRTSTNTPALYLLAIKHAVTVISLLAFSAGWCLDPTFIIMLHYCFVVLMSAHNENMLIYEWD